MRVCVYMGAGDFLLLVLFSCVCLAGGGGIHTSIRMSMSLIIVMSM